MSTGKFIPDILSLGNSGLYLQYKDPVQRKKKKTTIHHTNTQDRSVQKHQSIPEEKDFPILEKTPAATVTLLTTTDMASTGIKDGDMLADILGGEVALSDGEEDKTNFSVPKNPSSKKKKNSSKKHDICGEHHTQASPTKQGGKTTGPIGNAGGDTTTPINKTGGDYHRAAVHKNTSATITQPAPNTKGKDGGIDTDKKRKPETVTQPAPNPKGKDGGIDTDKKRKPEDTAKHPHEPNTKGSGGGKQNRNISTLGPHSVPNIKGKNGGHMTDANWQKDEHPATTSHALNTEGSGGGERPNTSHTAGRGGIMSAPPTTKDNIKEDPLFWKNTKADLVELVRAEQSSKDRLSRDNEIRKKALQVAEQESVRMLARVAALENALQAERKEKGTVNRASAVIHTPAPVQGTGKGTHVSTANAPVGNTTQTNTVPIQISPTVLKEMLTQALLEQQHLGQQHRDEHRNVPR